MSIRRYTVAIDGRSFVIDVGETAADRFLVSVDGRAFEATLLGDEDLPGSAISPGIDPGAVADAAPPAGASPMPVDVPRRPATPAPPTPPARTADAAGPRGDTIAAPMPGVVLEVHVGPGATVARGDPVLVLEAMKMRNTIRAPRDAVVTEVAVEAGQAVAAGDLLVRLDVAGR